MTGLWLWFTSIKNTYHITYIKISLSLSPSLSDIFFVHMYTAQSVFKLRKFSYLPIPNTVDTKCQSYQQLQFLVVHVLQQKSRQLNLRSLFDHLHLVIILFSSHEIIIEVIRKLNVAFLFIVQKCITSCLTPKHVKTEQSHKSLYTKSNDQIKTAIHYKNQIIISLFDHMCERRVDDRLFLHYPYMSTNMRALCTAYRSRIWHIHIKFTRSSLTSDRQIYRPPANSRHSVITKEQTRVKLPF